MTRPKPATGYSLRARELRREATPSEEALWRRIRKRQRGGKKFRRQHPIGPYILDFYCIERRIAVELDGPAHATDDVRAYDSDRTSYFQSLGVTELRFWNDEVEKDIEGVLRRIDEALSSPSPGSAPPRHPLPPAWPKPLLRGEGPIGRGTG